MPYGNLKGNVIWWCMNAEMLPKQKTQKTNDQMAQLNKNICTCAMRNRMRNLMRNTSPSPFVNSAIETSHQRGVPLSREHKQKGSFGTTNQFSSGYSVLLRMKQRINRIYF